MGGGTAGPLWIGAFGGDLLLQRSYPKERQAAIYRGFSRVIIKVTKTMTACFPQQKGPASIAKRSCCVNPLANIVFGIGFLPGNNKISQVTRKVSPYMDIAVDRREKIDAGTYLTIVSKWRCDFLFASV
jgi:hypothetical protein